ncbi:MAG: efflux RND transporter permease subunit [Immundisolibacteraceae bacterium]|nr:efflux RND transporter permease subunit [Immundisolibacteraceae bacterium]
MFRAAINNGVIVAVAALVLTVLGLVSIFRVPIQMIPDMDMTTLTVETVWPGATPQDVEREIIVEQEEFLRTLPNLQKMTSLANTGMAVVELEFALGTDINEVLIRTNNALSQVEDYPPNVDEPRILTSAFSDNWFIFYIAEPAAGNPLGIDIQNQLDYLEDHVKTRIERVAGVSEVRIDGGMNRQVRVYIDPAKLAERQITLSEFRQALLRRNRDVSGGDLDAGKRRYLVRTMGRFESVAEIENSVIARRDGELIYMRDLGYAEMTVAEQRNVSRYNGDLGLMVSIKRQRGANIMEVADGVAAAVNDHINPDLMEPQGLYLRFLHADTIYIKQAVGVIASNLVLGALLALGVLYLFLRSASSTFIGAVGIPICTIAAFLGLLATGRTINVISLSGVAFAIGMTLDNSIVVLENIQRHRQMGKERFDAALAGVREVWTAVLASTLTTIFVFVPLMTMQEEVGQLYSDIAIAISASIIFSMMVAITLVPSASANLAGGGDPVSHPTFLLNRIGNRFNRLVMRGVEWLMQGTERQIILIAGVLLLAIALVWALTPKAEYLPEGEEPVTFTLMFPPPGYNLEQMIAIEQQMLDTFVPEVDVDPELFHRGERPAPAVRWVLSTASPANVFMIGGTSDADDIDAMIDILTEQNANYPGMIAFSARGSLFSGNEGGTRSMDLEISGPDLEPLFGIGLKAFLRAKQVLDDPQIKPSPSSLSLGQPMVEIRPDWERAAELEVNADDLGYLVWALADGAYHDDFYEADDKIDIYIYSTTGTVSRPEDLTDLPIYTGKGDVIPLSAVAELRQTVNTETIRRVNGERTITLSVVAPRDMPLEAAVEVVQAEVVDALKAEGLPPGIGIKIAGASDKLTATRAALAGDMGLAVLLAYLLMVAIFRHWGYPLLIMLTVPLGIAGGIFGLWLMNLLPSVRQPFDMITMLGFLVLIGVVVNNPILLVEQALQNRRRGMDIASAVIESTRVRVRPIMMTTLTTLGGLAPLVFLPREGTELYRGLGIIVLFGLLSSTLLTLTFMPSLLALVLKLGERLKGGVSGEAAVGR